MAGQSKQGPASIDTSQLKTASCTAAREQHATTSAAHDKALQEWGVGLIDNTAMKQAAISLSKASDGVTAACHATPEQIATHEKRHTPRP